MRDDAFDRMPKVAAGYHPTTGEPILVKRGELGYWLAEGCDPDSFNAERGVTPAQREAMLAGSMWGWSLPIADPRTWTLRAPERADRGRSA